MAEFDKIIFNLFLNSGCSFMAGILIIILFIKLFRIETSYCKLYLLTLPFVKIIIDFVRGIPVDSFIYRGINISNLPLGHRTLKIGFGFSEWGPNLLGIFSMKDMTGKEYPISFADLMAYVLTKKFGADIVFLSIIFALGISVYLVSKRLLFYLRFEIKRRMDRKSDNSRLFQTIYLKFRRVDVYISSSYLGTPFTGRILNPYICIPETTFNLLTKDEIEAVIQHELAHIKYFEMITIFTIKFLGDIFWFVPGYRFLSRKIDRLKEVLADRMAYKCNLSGQLASALVKLGEINLDSRHGVLYSALFRERSLLSERVKRLTNKWNKEKASRFFWNKLIVKIVITLWATGGVIMSTFGGNQNAFYPPNFLGDFFMRLLGFK